MAVNRATEFEALKVLHTLWVAGQMSVVGVRQILASVYKLHLVNITNQAIVAETTDKKSKYKINQ